MRSLVDDLPELSATTNRLALGAFSGGDYYTYDLQGRQDKQHALDAVRSMQHLPTYGTFHPAVYALFRLCAAAVKHRRCSALDWAAEQVQYSLQDGVRKEQARRLVIIMTDGFFQ